MSAYYNEFSPEAAAWLRELIIDGVIAPGEVDERSITEVKPSDLKGFTQCHFFAGIGVWSYALRKSMWSDDRSVWTGSCPCQPFSSAGKKKGTEDERHLWPAWFELVSECQPSNIFGEQVASSEVIGKVDGTGENVWWDAVQADLERASYAVAPFDLPAAGFGAPHIRQRLWFVAERLDNADSSRAEIGLSESTQRQERHSKINDNGGGRLLRFSEGRSEFNGMGNAGIESSERHTREFPEAQATSSSERDSDGRHDNRHSDASETRGLANTAGNGLDQRRSSNAAKKCNGAGGNSSDIGTHSHNSFWSSPDWLGCRDGKFRPVESGTFPLVDGATDSMGSIGNPSASEVKSTKEARSMRLRGYGNAIVAPVAIEFISAYMESAA